MNLSSVEEQGASPRYFRFAVDFILPTIVGLALALVFWLPLFRGGGFIGGDTYNYYFPLKHFYGKSLQTGVLPLWHTGIGNGVPILGESQTGALYPPNLVAYSLLDLNTAYNAIFLLHYVLAFLFTYWLGRSIRIGAAGALLCAIVFVYGWFPPRACLEWAIVTGALMPAVILAGLRFLDTGRFGWAASVSCALAVQLLAGHFNLAWITLVSLGVLAIVYPSRTTPTLLAWRRKLVLSIAVLSAFGLAAVQLIPSWELKARSQRDDKSFRELVEQGLVPTSYLPQAVAPWRYYADPERTLASIGAKTNKIEAHLYFGLVPLALAILGIASGKTLSRGWPWVILAAVGLLLATGTAMPWLADVPGFAFFRYCGRYAIATQLAVAVLAGMALDRLFFGSTMIRVVSATVLLAATSADLYLVAQRVQYVEATTPPIIDLLSESPVCRLLGPTDRVMAVDGNTLALSPAACVPPYLGMGPAEYYKIWDAMPDVFHGETKYSEATGETLRRTGVTHLLTFSPLPPDWPATIVWRGYDRFLHSRWARDAADPIYLYRFNDARGRAYAQRQDGAPLPEATVEIVELRPHQVIIDADMPESGRVVLTDLIFPGWSATVDAKEATPIDSNLSRVVPVASGKHRIIWTYWPRSVALGAAVSAISAIAMLLAIWRFRLKGGRRDEHRTPPD